MKKLATLFALLVLGSCSDTNKKYYTITPEDPPAPPCDGEIVGRMTLIEDNLEGPPTITHGVMFDNDCDPATPPVFVPDEEFPGQGKPYQDD